MMISPVPAQAVNDFSNDFSVVGLYRLESGALTTNNSPVVGCGGANSLVNSSDSVTANASVKRVIILDLLFELVVLIYTKMMLIYVPNFPVSRAPVTPASPSQCGLNLTPYLIQAFTH
jgi:hypothetical protein